jgi:hypothetical protein
MIAISGQSLPSELAHKSYRAFFDNEGKFLHSFKKRSLLVVLIHLTGHFQGNIPQTDLKTRLQGKVPQADIPGTISFIQQCLVLDAADRPSAMDLFSVRWVKEGSACSCGFC